MSSSSVAYRVSRERTGSRYPRSSAAARSAYSRQPPGVVAPQAHNPKEAREGVIEGRLIHAHAPADGEAGGGLRHAPVDHAVFHGCCLIIRPPGDRTITPSFLYTPPTSNKTNPEPIL